MDDQKPCYLGTLIDYAHLDPAWLSLKLWYRGASGVVGGVLLACYQTESLRP